MKNLKSVGWIENTDNEYQPWVDGYEPADIIDRFASGSSGHGQIADLINTNSISTSPVSTFGASTLPLKVKRNIIHKEWASVTIVLFRVDAVENELAIKSTAEKLEYIRDVFDVSVSALAKVVKTSRTSLYTWLEGEEPREQSIERINLIHEYAVDWNKMNPYHFSPGPLVRQQLRDLPSLTNLMEQKELNSHEINKAFTLILELMHKRNMRLNSNKKNIGNPTLDAAEKDEKRRGLTRTISAEE